MEKKILNILSEIRPEFDFSESSDYIAEGLLDSFDIIQLVASLDAEFNISIGGMDILPENFTSVDTIIQLLTKHGISK
jgi:acyl carrier protein